jgi:hypothetical protein
MRLHRRSAKPSYIVLLPAALICIFAALSLFSCSSSSDQPSSVVTTWARTYGPSLSGLAAIRATPDGSYIAVGYSGLIVKLGSMGEIVWAKKFNGGDQTALNSVHALADGGFLVAGNIRNGAEEPRDSRPVILKLDGQGNILWQRTYHASSFDLMINSVIDGGQGLVATGMSRFPDGSWFTYASWLMRIDEYGNVVWANTYPGFGAPSILHVTDDGGYVVLQAGEYPALGHHHRLAILRLDRLGTPVWQKYLVSTDVSVQLDARKTIDGGTIALSENNLEDGITLTKLSSVGDIEWQRAYRGPTMGEADVWGRSVQASADGSYLVVTRATGTSGERVGILLKVDAGGAIEWQRTYDGLPDLQNVPNVDVAEDGSFVISGQSLSDRWVVAKVDSRGQIEGCGLRDVSLLRMTNSAAQQMADVAVPLRMDLLVEAVVVAVTNLNLDAVGACRAKAE